MGILILIQERENVVAFITQTRETFFNHISSF